MLQALKTHEHISQHKAKCTDTYTFKSTVQLYLYIHKYTRGNTHKEAQHYTVMYQVLLAFHFNNSPPALMVIRYVSRQPLNPEMLSKCANTLKKNVEVI